MITRAVTLGLTKIRQALNPGIQNQIAILKPFENPSTNVQYTNKDLGKGRFISIAQEVAILLKLGHNLVAIDVGRMSGEDFCFGQSTIGSKLTSFFDNPEILKQISQQTSRQVTFLEGVKYKNKEKIEMRKPFTVIYETEPVETYYAVLADSKKVTIDAPDKRIYGHGILYAE